MKKLIIVAIVAAIVGGLGLYGGKVWDFLKNESVVYVKETAEPIIQKEKVKELDSLIEEAQEQAQAEIETAAKAQYDKAVAEAKAASEKYIADENEKISNKVKEEYIAKIEETITSKEY
jgi:hypothetical protein